MAKTMNDKTEGEKKAEENGRKEREDEGLGGGGRTRVGGEVAGGNCQGISSHLIIVINSRVVFSRCRRRRGWVVSGPPVNSLKQLDCLGFLFIDPWILLPLLTENLVSRPNGIAKRILFSVSLCRGSLTRWLVSVFPETFFTFSTFLARLTINDRGDPLSDRRQKLGSFETVQKENEKMGTETCGSKIGRNYASSQGIARHREAPRGIATPQECKRAASGTTHAALALNDYRKIR